MLTIQQDSQRRTYNAVASVAAGVVPERLQIKIGSDVVETIDLPPTPHSVLAGGVKYWKPARANDYLWVQLYPNGRVNVVATIYSPPFSNLDDTKGKTASLVVTPVGGPAVTVDLGTSIPEDMPQFAMWS